jgi:hypothetical protein
MIWQLAAQSNISSWCSAKHSLIHATMSHASPAGYSVSLRLYSGLEVTTSSESADAYNKEQHTQGLTKMHQQLRQSLCALHHFASHMAKLHLFASRSVFQPIESMQMHACPPSVLQLMYPGGNLQSKQGNH